MAISIGFLLTIRALSASVSSIPLAVRRSSENQRRWIRIATSSKLIFPTNWTSCSSPSVCFSWLLTTHHLIASPFQPWRLTILQMQGSPFFAPRGLQHAESVSPQNRSRIHETDLLIQVSFKTLHFSSQISVVFQPHQPRMTKVMSDVSWFPGPTGIIRSWKTPTICNEATLANTRNTWQLFEARSPIQQEPVLHKFGGLPCCQRPADIRVTAMCCLRASFRSNCGRNLRHSSRSSDTHLPIAQTRTHTADRSQRWPVLLMCCTGEIEALWFPHRDAFRCRA